MSKWTKIDDLAVVVDRDIQCHGTCPIEMPVVTFRLYATGEKVYWHSDSVDFAETKLGALHVGREVALDAWRQGHAMRRVRVGTAWDSWMGAAEERRRHRAAKD